MRSTVLALLATVAIAALLILILQLFITQCGFKNGDIETLVGLAGGFWVGHICFMLFSLIREAIDRLKPFTRKKS